MPFAFQVIGAGRSGTSLLACMIDEHPQCTMRLETFSHRHLLGERNLDAFFAACRNEADATPDLLWGHKTTTEHLRHIELAEFAARTPPVIFISRNKADCIASKMKRAGHSLEAATERWDFSVAAFEQLCAKARVLPVRYEALVTSPEVELMRVCAFLDVQFNPAMLRGAESEKMPAQYRR